MLRIVHLEEIERLLLQLPGLVKQQERRSTEFVTSVARWLTALETVFVANRLHQAADIATLRSDMIAVEHGQIPSGLQFRARPTRSRVLGAVASQSLQRATAVASTVISESRPRLLEAERVAQQIVAVALSRGLPIGRENGSDNTQYLQSLRGELVAAADLASAVVHLEGLVGPHDALVVLDRALAQI